MRILIITFLVLCLSGCAYWSHTYEKIVQEPVYNKDGTRALDEDGNPAWKDVLRLTYDSYHGGDTRISPFLHKTFPGYDFDASKQSVSEDAAYKLCWPRSPRETPISSANSGPQARLTSSFAMSAGRSSTAVLPTPSASGSRGAPWPTPVFPTHSQT